MIHTNFWLRWMILFMFVSKLKTTYLFMYFFTNIISVCSGMFNIGLSVPWDIKCWEPLSKFIESKKEAYKNELLCLSLCWSWAFLNVTGSVFWSFTIYVHIFNYEADFYIIRIYKIFNYTFLIIMYQEPRSNCTKYCVIQQFHY